MSDDLRLNVTEYKIQITRDGDEILEMPETQEESDNYNLDLKSINELGEKAREIGKFNERQIMYCEKDPNRDFILKRIINKTNNN